MKFTTLLCAAVAVVASRPSLPHAVAAPPREASPQRNIHASVDPSRHSDGAGQRNKAQDESESADSATANRLAELAWLVGKWTDQGEDATNVSVVKWTRNRAFLTRSFQVVIDGHVELEGTQVIGWDPIHHRIRSWTFDSSGGYGEGVWLRDGNQWIVKKTFVLPDGERASALNIITPVDENHFKWKSINREIGGRLQPNIPETTLVRKTSDSPSEHENRAGEHDHSQSHPRENAK